MRIGDVSTGVSKLRLSLEALQMAWRETREHWQDHNAATLEDKYLEPLGAHVKMTMEAMTRLSTLLAAAQRACDPDGERVL